MTSEDRRQPCDVYLRWNGQIHHLVANEVCQLSCYSFTVLGWAEKYLLVDIQKSAYPINCLLD